MSVLGATGIGALVLLTIVILVFLRRVLTTRGGGTIEMSVRLSRRFPGRGWATGVARFVGEDLRWHRMFSLAVRPRRVLRRRDIVVESRRQPEGAELFALTADSVILHCATSRGGIEIAMNQCALTGFLSWLEAAPPGAASKRFATY